MKGERARMALMVILHVRRRRWPRELSLSFMPRGRLATWRGIGALYYRPAASTCTWRRNTSLAAIGVPYQIWRRVGGASKLNHM